MVAEYLLAEVLRYLPSGLSVPEIAGRPCTRQEASMEYTDWINEGAEPEVR